MLDEIIELCYNSLKPLADSIKDKKLGRNLQRARIKYNSAEYTALALCASALAALIAFLSFVWLSISTAAVLFFVVFAAAFFIASKIPETLAKNYEKKIENELSESIKTIALELKLDTGFEEVLKRHADKTALGKEFMLIANKISHGERVEKALEDFAESLESPFVKQCMGQLAVIYIKGNQSAENLVRIADAKIKTDMAEIKERNQKQAYYAMLFVASSTVLPTISQAYLVLSSSFMAVNYNDIIWQVIAAVTFANIFLLVKMNEL